MVLTPKFPEKPVIRKDAATGEIVLSCSLEGNPKPDLTYFLNDKQITPQPGKLTFVYVEAGTDVYNCEIRIANPTTNDGGVYKIKALNSAGESNTLNYVVCALIDGLFKGFVVSAKVTRACSNQSMLDYVEVKLGIVPPSLHSK
ncbi:unnamed protein product [Hydatigera taeniaeformis]|uniref:I-set domain-containing protein n=1 Tax=Hydatigena taeniaeformis TaxID=6205 RepID=A0A0R3WZ50_HYDTA|nr:unnamed protein product [Hydatigera taeniaeformis]